VNRGSAADGPAETVEEPREAEAAVVKGKEPVGGAALAKGADVKKGAAPVAGAKRRKTLPLQRAARNNLFCTIFFNPVRLRD
jgi:hypothetical protein